MQSSNSSDDFLDQLLDEMASPWGAFYASAYRAAGSPSDLGLVELANRPIQYDGAAYAYLETRYNERLSLATKGFANAISISGSPEAHGLVQALFRIANWQSVWKQTAPLLAFSRAFGANETVVDSTIGAFILAQAIPSTLFDKILDESSGDFRSEEWIGILNVSLLSAYGQLEKCELGPDLVRTLRAHSISMYSKMVTQARLRRQGSQLCQGIEEYIWSAPGPQSSVFFRIGLEWAAILARASDVGTAREIGGLLATVRQLNDELLDWKDDLNAGQVSLPLILAAQVQGQRAAVLDCLTETKNGGVKLNSGLMTAVMEVGLPGAASISARLLHCACEKFASIADPQLGFEVCCVLGLRIGVLRRLAMNGWSDPEMEYRAPWSGGPLCD